MKKKGLKCGRFESYYTEVRLFLSRLLLRRKGLKRRAFGVPRREMVGCSFGCPVCQKVPEVRPRFKTRVQNPSIQVPLCCKVSIAVASTPLENTLVTWMIHQCSHQ